MKFPFFPDLYVDSVHHIDYQHLYDAGYRALIFDIDNTLVPHGQDITSEIVILFMRIHYIGFRTVLLSNNNYQRVYSFNNKIRTRYIYYARKPKRDGFLLAVEKAGVPIDKCIMIGDSLFDDIRGANRVNMKNILVKYIGHNLPGKKGVRRFIEKLILFFYGKTKKTSLL